MAKVLYAIGDNLLYDISLGEDSSLLVSSRGRNR